MQGILVQLLPWAWGVPDLTLIAFVLTVGAAPQRWVMLSTVAGLLTVVWMIRAPTQLLVSYLLFGGMIRLLSGRWDVADQRVQVLLAGFGSVVTLMATLWQEDAWSLSLVGGLGLRAVMTGLAVPVIRWMLLIITRQRRWDVDG